MGGVLGGMGLTLTLSRLRRICDPSRERGLMDKFEGGIDVETEYRRGA